MSALLDYIINEMRLEAEELNALTKDYNTYKNSNLKDGKKYAQNILVSYEAQQRLVHSVKSLKIYFDKYIELVPNDVADEVIDLYKAYKEDIICNFQDVDKQKIFRRVHLVSLFDFAIAYGKYNQLDDYVSIWLDFNNSTNRDEALSSKADAITVFSESSKKYNTDEAFIRGCIEILNPNFDDKKSRVKITQSYKDRAERADNLFKSLQLETETRLDKAKKHINSLNRSKFR